LNALAYTNQELKSHAINTSEIALKYSGKCYAEVCARRIRSVLNKPFSSSDFNYIVKVASTFHDAGKAADHYQMQFEAQQNKKPSFSLHEIPSAIITKTFMEQKGNDYESILLASLAVLFHHTAMRPYRLQEDLLKSRNHTWSFSKFKADIDLLSEKVFGTKFSLQRIEKENAMAFMKWVGNVTRSANISRYAKLYCLVLNPVIYGDNIDAKSRGISKKRSKLVEELEETLDA